MKSDTNLRIEYVEYSWKYDFPEEIELALENDYVKNNHLYDKNTLGCIAVILLISPDIGGSQLIKLVREIMKNKETFFNCKPLKEIDD